MAIRTMTGKEKFGQSNVEFIPDFSTDTNVEYIRHNWDCPHRNDGLTVKNRFDDCHSDCKHNDGLYIETTYENRVISLREYNGYDDSDFYALVWDDTLNKPIEIEYGTTRGWTYCNSAKVDATPDIVEKYKRYQYDQYIQGLVKDNISQSTVPTPGKQCKVIKGRKFPIGLICTVIRTNINKYGVGRWAKETTSVLVKYDTGNGIITQDWIPNIENLEVVNPSQYVMNEEKIRQEKPFR